MMRFTEHEFRGIVAIVLAVGLIAVILAMIIGITITGMRMNSVGSEVVIAVLGAIVGALAGFIGGRVTIVTDTETKEPPK
jgi:hypothetical protein